MVIYLYLVVGVGFLWSQENRILDHYDYKDGLSPGHIRCITQDRRGYLWIGTYGGLTRYDGYQFKVYQHDPRSTHSLADNIIFSLYVDKGGTLWIGTEKGLQRFIEASEKFINVQPSGDKLTYLSPLRVRYMLEDSKGIFWLTTYHGEVLVLNRKTGQFKHYPHSPHSPGSIDNTTFAHIHEDRSGNIWIGDFTGVARFHRQKDAFIYYQLNPKKPTRSIEPFVECIYEDRSSTIWIGTRNDGVYRFHRETDTFTSYRHQPGNPNSLSNNNIRSIFEDRESNLWIGTAQGLNCMNKKNQVFTHYRHNPQDPYSLSYDSIFRIFEDQRGSLWILTNREPNRWDRESNRFFRYKYSRVNNKYIYTSCYYEDRSGILWFGTGGAIYKFDYLERKFTCIGYDPLNPLSLSCPRVRAIFEDSAGILWIGTAGGGINRWDPGKGGFVHYQHQRDIPNTVSGNYIMSIVEGPPGILWIGTGYSGLNRFEPKTGKFTYYCHHPDNPYSLSENFIKCLYADSFGTLWVGTASSGLDRLDTDTMKFYHYRHQPDNPHSLGHNMILDMIEDREGNLWIGTEWGLHLMDRNNGTFTRFLHDPQSVNSLTDNRVADIFQDSNGYLWISTFMGLNRMDPKTHTITRYLDKASRTNASVGGVLEDNNGNIWFISESGLSMMNPQTNHFIHYDYCDGLQDINFYVGSHFKNSKGEMFYGGPKGFNRFFPEKITSNSYLPPIVISSCKKFGKDLIFDKPLSDMERLEFSYNEAFISFEFASLSFSNSEKNRYAYKLEGLHDDWIPLGTRRSVEFAGLKPGSYRFKIKASNSSGIWNEEGASLELIIHPPFWQTWWFQVLLVLLIIAGVLYWHRMRVKFISNKLLKKAMLDRYLSLNNISSREMEIVHLVIDGNSNKEIEEKLFISSHTVKNHLYNIYKKLNINSRFQLINKAQRINTVEINGSENMSAVNTANTVT